MSIYDKSSLVLIPSGTKTGKVFSQKPVSGDGDFTFTRASAATRVNADGNIEKETQNLILQSNNFGTYWSVGGTLVGGQSGYDGTNNAWSFTSSTGTSGLSQNITTGGVQTFSAYIKKNATNGVRIYMFGSANASPFFNLNNGSVVSLGNALDATIVEYNSEWWRVSVTANSTLSSVYFYCTNNNQTQVVGTITIQDAQVEQGLVARDYIETTTAAVYGGITDNTPRLDYTDSSCPALLLEPQRTNLTPQSEYFDSGYTFTNVTTAANAAISPEGVSNAYEMTDDATNGNHRFIRQITGNTIGQSYTYSIFLKKGTMTNAFLNLFSGGTIANVSVDLENGTISAGSGTSQTIEDYGNDWYRCSITGVAGDSSVYIYLYMNSLGGYSGAGDNMYFYGAQLEQASYATSYIPTYGSSVSRVVDSCLATSVSDLIGQEQGTLFMDADFVAGNGEDQTILIGVNGYNDYVFIQMTSSNRVEGGIIVNSTEHCRIGEVKPSGRYKCAFAYANNDFVFYINGEQIGVETSGSMSGFAVDFINLNFNNKGYSLNNHSLFKTRLSNEELAALTTI